MVGKTVHKSLAVLGSGLPFISPERLPSSKCKRCLPLSPGLPVLPIGWPPDTWYLNVLLARWSINTCALRIQFTDFWYRQLSKYSLKLPSVEGARLGPSTCAVIEYVLCRKTWHVDTARREFELALPRLMIRRRIHSTPEPASYILIQKTLWLSIFFDDACLDWKDDEFFKFLLSHVRNQRSEHLQMCSSATVTNE